MRAAALFVHRRPRPLPAAGRCRSRRAALVLPQCDLVVSHGGSGSIMGALAHGRPSVLMPLGADQPHNARRCVALGVARELEPATVTPEEIRVTVAGVLADERYRSAAERMRDEINALPGPEQIVPLLERLARSSK